MRLVKIVVAVTGLSIVLGACGREEQSGNDLTAAAEQSDPASAAILENAARNGADPQAALDEAAKARMAVGDTAEDGVTLQARPNLPNSPNRKDGTRPPDKVAVPPS